MVTPTPAELLDLLAHLFPVLLGVVVVWYGWRVMVRYVMRLDYPPEAAERNKSRALALSIDRLERVCEVGDYAPGSELWGTPAPCGCCAVSICTRHVDLWDSTLPVDTIERLSAGRWERDGLL